MRHTITIGIEPAGKVALLAAGQDPDNQRALLATMTDANGLHKGVQYVAAYTLTTDHAAARRVFSANAKPAEPAKQDKQSKK